MKSFLFAILTLSLIPTMGWSYIGSETGNGGDSTAIQIKIIGQAMLAEIKYASKEIPVGVDIEKLAKSLESAKIETTFKLLFLRGKLKNAINYPDENRILFNSIMWRQLSIKDKRMLVVHELLGLNGIDDSDYRLTFELEKIASASKPYFPAKDDECFDENHNMKTGVTVYANIVNIMIISDIYSDTDRDVYCSISVKDTQNQLQKLSATYANNCKRIFENKATSYRLRVVNNHICEILN